MMNIIQMDPTDFLKIHDALGQAGIFFRRRDEMNAQIHLAKSIRYSPITSITEAAYDRCVQILMDNGIEPDDNQKEEV